MHFRNEVTNVLIGGYLSEQAAREDYDAVLNCGERILGAAVVSKDLKGNVTVEESDHAVTEAATGGAGVGLVVGLFAPPLLAATVLGAALGAAGGAAVHKKIGEGLGQTAGETIPIGGAGLLVAYPHAAAGTVEPAVRRAIQKVVGQAEGSHVDALKGALADAQAKLADVGAG
jgi:arylsulfatase